MGVSVDEALGCQCLFQSSTGTAIRFGRVTWMRNATKATFSPSHSATPVQTIVLVMISSSRRILT